MLYERLVDALKHSKAWQKGAPIERHQRRPIHII